MKKLSCAAVVAALLFVVAMPARATDGRAFHGAPAPSSHTVVAPSHHHPVVVAPHHAFVRPRVLVGAPFYWPAYSYPYPAYAYVPPPVYVPSYAPPEPTYWYYCQEAGAYYPYVQECPSGWLTVVPQSAR